MRLSRADEEYYVLPKINLNIHHRNKSQVVELKQQSQSDYIPPVIQNVLKKQSKNKQISMRISSGLDEGLRNPIYYPSKESQVRWEAR